MKAPHCGLNEHYRVMTSLPQGVAAKMGRVGWSVGLGVSVLFVVYALIAVEAGTERASGSPGKSSTPPVPQPVTMTMDTIDYIRSGALVVAFLATNFAGRDTWILTDLIVTFSFGAAWFFFPDALFSYQVRHSRSWVQDSMSR